MKRAYDGESKSARRVLDLTLREVHRVIVDSAPGGAEIRLAVENIETGDKFALTLAAGHLPAKLGADVESLDDLEYLLVEGLRAEHAAGCSVAVKAEDKSPAILATSNECAADGSLAQRFTIRVRFLKGIPGRQKLHSLELLVPVSSIATKDDAVRIMFRKLKESYERSNAGLRAELSLLRLQSNNRVFFGVAHSVSRFATTLKTCTVATVQEDTFKPVPKTEVGTFRPAARAGSVLTVVPSPHRLENSCAEDFDPRGFQENWIRGPVNWTPEVKLTGGCFEAGDDGALVVKRPGLYEVHYMFDCPHRDADLDPYGLSLSCPYWGVKRECYPTAPWNHVETPTAWTISKDNKVPDLYVSRAGTGAWLPPDGRGVVNSTPWGTLHSERHKTSIENRLTCGCVLYARINIEQGADRTTPGTHGRIFHLESGDRIEMQFWLHAARARTIDSKYDSVQPTCKLGDGGLKEHVVRLDDCSKACVQERLFATAPWLKFTLVADKPESDHDVGHVPLRADQLPALSADDLMPLQLCTRLSSLHVKGGPGAELNHLRFLQGLTNLSELVVTDARASDLAPIGELTNLTRLHITGLELGSGAMVSIQPLSSLQDLTELSLHGSSSIIDGVPLGKLVSLKGLDLTASGIVNRTPLQQPGLVIHAA